MYPAAVPSPLLPECLGRPRGRVCAARLEAGEGRGTGRGLFVSPPQLPVLDFPDVLQLNICMFGVPVIAEPASLRYSCLALQRQDVQVLLNVFLAPESLGVS